MGLSAEFTILTSRPGTAIVEVLGEHDLATDDQTASLFSRLVREYPLVVIDLSRAAYIDSSFLTNLISAQRQATGRGHTLLLQVGTEPIVARMLEVTNFLRHFDHVSSREEAMAWAPAEGRPRSQPSRQQRIRLRGYADERT